MAGVREVGHSQICGVRCGSRSTGGAISHYSRPRGLGAYTSLYKRLRSVTHAMYFSGPSPGIFSCNGPTIRRKRGYILTTDPSAISHAACERAVLQGRALDHQEDLPDRPGQLP
eukprot:4727663-Pyramimonas_sp.AAC.1